MNGNAVILEAEGIDAGYGEVNILHGVSVTVHVGGIVTVIGPNGAGKSTLLKTLYGLLPTRAGTISLHRDGGAHDVTRARPHELTRLGMNFVPQTDNVFPNMSVAENLEVGALIRGKERRSAIARVLEWVPLLAERRRQRAGTLSGGQRKLLAIARALVTEPKLVLLDEPSAGLAPLAVDEVFEKLVEIRERGIAIIMVEQNARRSLALADYGYVLDMGRNRFEGPGRELLHDAKIADLYLGGGGRLQAASEDDA